MRQRVSRSNGLLRRQQDHDPAGYALFQQENFGEFRGQLPISRTKQTAVGRVDAGGPTASFSTRECRVSQRG